MWSLFSNNLREFPYQYDEKDSYKDTDSLFTIYKGVNKSQEDVTIFKFDKSKGSTLECEVVKKGIQRLKTIRHPGILKYVSEFETSSDIYFATERVEPLRHHLQALDVEKIVLAQYLPKGLLDVVRAVMFLNKDAILKHNNLFAGSIFVTDAGEWKIGDLCFMNELNEPYPLKPFEPLLRYNPPEVGNNIVSPSCPTADSWGLGILIWEIYNGGIMEKRSDLKNLNNVPSNLVEVFCQLIGMPESRISVDQFLTRCSVPKGYFENDLIYSLQFIGELYLKIPMEKTKFFKYLSQQVHKFPKDIAENKILVALQTAVSYGDTGSAIIEPIIMISRKVSDANRYGQLVTPCLVRLYQSSDRAVRSKLLQSVPLYIDKMSSEILNKEIFNNFANGFLDSHPVIRVLTIKSVPFMAPYLNHNNLNVELMRHFARLQAKDEKDEIRTYITQYLGKIAQYLDPSIRPKILLSAFIRALHDPCHSAKIAGISALVSAQQFFTIKDIAEKILPPLCVLTVDPELTVRENALKAIKGLVNKLEMVSNNPNLKEDMEKLVTVKAESRVVSNTNWGRWAVSAITSTLGATLGLKSSEKASKEQGINNVQESNLNINIERDTVNLVEEIREISLVDSSNISPMLDFMGEDNWDECNWSPIETTDQGSIDLAAIEEDCKREDDSNQKLMKHEQNTDQPFREVQEQKRSNSRKMREQRLAAGSDNPVSGSVVRSSGPLKLGIKKS